MVHLRKWNYLIYVFLICLTFFITNYLLINDASAQDSKNKSYGENNSLSEQIILLKERQDLLIEATQKDLQRVYYVFAGVAAIFTILTIIFGSRQIITESRRQKVEGKYFVEMQSVMNSFRDNISTINSLISTLKQTFDFQGEIQKRLLDVDKSLKDLRVFKEKEELGYRSQVDAMNARSAQLFIESKIHTGDRESFKREENKAKIHSLSAHFDTLKTTGEITDLASPVSLFMRALGHFNEIEYEEALAVLKQARDSAKAQLSSPLSQYGTWDVDEIREKLTILINESHYHLGIIYYNLGRYEESRNEFKSAFERNQLDFRSRIYIPELMFFDMGIDPSVTEAEFRLVEVELNNITLENRKRMSSPWDKQFASLKMRQGGFYLPKLIKLESRIMWRRYEDIEKAIECFWQAKEHDSESMFISFCLAQSMHIIGRSALWRDQTPETLFREVFHRFRDDAILKTEPILLCLLYYCAAISCWLGNIQKENPRLYLNQARQYLQRIPKGIRVFSPINKINLSREDILKEMQQMEELL
ncbi:MAG: tetratricopeptide repeat protein [bacterium]